jgi:hypothetical protein
MRRAIPQPSHGLLNGVRHNQLISDLHQHFQHGRRETFEVDFPVVTTSHLVCQSRESCAGRHPDRGENIGRINLVFRPAAFSTR